MVKKIIAIILLIIGVLLILSPFLKNEIVKYTSQHNKITAFTAKDIEKNNQKKAEFDYDSVQLPSMRNVAEGAMKFDKKAVVGGIAIPSVGIDLLILKGTNTANLLAGATTMKQEQKMGAGNYALAGHHMRRESILFGPLMQVKAGTKVYLNDQKYIYTYTIDSTKIIPDTNVEVLDETKEATITLITCDKPSETDKRFVATGKLIKKERLHSSSASKYFEQ